MKSKLTRKLDPDQLPEFKENYIRALPFRKHLADVLEAEIESLHGAMRDEAHFDNPSWPYFQADRLGQEKMARRIIGMLRDEQSQS